VLGGRHNQLNALAAIAAARHVSVPVRESLAALAAFRGVKRRMELRGTIGGIAVYDDFAHHPTAIAATLEGLRHEVGKARILAVLEPRSTTMKRGTMKDALAGSLEAADLVFCYAANLSWDAAAAIASVSAARSAFVCTRSPSGCNQAAARPGDHILIMSNGAFGGIHDKLLAQLANASRNRSAPSRGTG
jgi:UDP-N-acetylmuramate: L-alanyl-gamma-D-glutamyl-meso-diaminopimelate ligase